MPHLPVGRADAVRSTLSIALLGSAASLLAAVPAVAAPAAPELLDDAIVVTARKQAETVLEVPVAVTAMSADALRDRQVSSATELAQFTPGLTMNQSFGRNGDRPIIRGASNVIVTEGKVGVFIDGIPFFGDFSSIDLAGAQRVEVIKGPQSAVFGRGTLAGAINIVMPRPGDYLKGRVSGTLGTYSRQEFSATVSGPITSGIGFEAGARYYNVGGQWENTAVPGTRIGGQRTKSSNLALFLDPTDNLSASVRWLHQVDDDQHMAIRLQPASDNNCFLNTRTYFCGVVPPVRDMQINTDRLQRPGLYRKADRLLGRVDWDIAGSGYSLGLQGGYSNMKEITGTDQTYDGRKFLLLRGACPVVAIGNQDCNVSPFETTAGSYRRNNTIEARLTSPSTDRLRWRVGGYTAFDRTLPNTSYLQAGDAGLPVLVDQKRVRNYAVFGGLDFDLTPDLTFGAELRHQIDKVHNTSRAYVASEFFTPEQIARLTRPNPNQVIGANLDREATFKATLPRLTLNWQARPDLSFYAQYAQGNSPGGFNPLTAPKTTFSEEKLINYEIGMKTTGFGFGYLAVSLFWQDYKDQVLTNTYTTQTQVNSYAVNIGRTRLRGLEVEGNLPLVDDVLKLQFNYTYLDATITRGIESEMAVLLKGSACKTGAAVNLDLPGCRDAASIVGHRPPMASKHAGSAGLRFNHHLSGDFDLFAGVDYIYRSSFFDQVTNLAKTGDAHTFNAQIGVHDSNGLRVTLWGRNMMNNRTPVGILRYLDLVAPKSPSGDNARAFAITPPRKPEYGITVAKSF